MAAIWIGCGVGCGATYGPVPAGGAVGQFAYVIVDSLPAGATIALDGEERGVAPVRVKLPLNDLGQLPADIEITLQWTDGRSDTTYRLQRGLSPPMGQIKINNSGMLVQ